MKSFFFNAVLILIAFQANGQSILWEKQWTRGNYEIPLRIKINQDSTFVSGGCWYGTLSNTALFPSFLLKIDKNGTIIWDTLGRKLTTCEQDIAERPKGGYLFTASNEDTINNKYSVFLQKIGVNGDTSSQINYPNNYQEIFPNKLMILSDDDYLIAGYLQRQLVDDPSGNNNYYFLQRTDSSGNTKWFKTYAKDAGTYHCDMIMNNKGNIVLSGVYTKGDPSYSFHPYLIEVSPEGDSIQSKRILIRGLNNDENQNRVYNNIIQTSDGGYALSGFIDSMATPTHIEIGFIAKIDSQFNLQWKYLHRSFTVSQGVHTSKVKELKDSSFVLLGNDDPGGNFFILKVNKDGQFISKNTLASSISTSLVMYDWAFLNDSSVIVAGRGSTGAYLARVDKVGKPFAEQDTCKNFIASFIAKQTGDSLQFINTSNGGYAYANQSVWKFSDSTISTNFNAKYFVTGRIDSIWAKLIATNPNRCKDTIASKVIVKQYPLLTPTYKNTCKAIIFPNPTNESITIQTSDSRGCKFTIYSFLGQVLSEHTIQDQQLVIDLSSLQRGLYFYHSQLGESIDKGKIVKE